MKLNSLIQHHIKNLRKFDNFRYAESYLQKNGFRKIGSGCESVVYSREGFDYVIKLQYNAFSNSGTKYDVPNDIHFANTVIFSSVYATIVVQEKCENTIMGADSEDSNIRHRFEKFRQFITDKFKCSDLHDENVGIVRGRMVVFDWNIR